MSNNISRVSGSSACPVMVQPIQRSMPARSVGKEPQKDLRDIVEISQEYRKIRNSGRIPVEYLPEYSGERDINGNFVGER